MEALLQLDSHILLFLQDYVRQPWLNPIMTFITTLGNKGAFWILLALLFLLIRKHRREGIGMVIAIGIGVIIANILLKNIVARPRPFAMIEGLSILVKAPTDWSFPSGHTCCSFASAVTMLGLSKKKFAVPAIILAVLIGFSRLYVGVHYPTDVLAGAVIGTISALISLKFMGSIFYDKNIKKFERI